MNKGLRIRAALCLLGWASLSGAAQPAPLRYAKNFELTRHPGHTLVEVRNLARESEARYTYALVPRGEPLPELPDKALVVRTPVERVIAMETVYIGHMDALGMLDRLIGAATVGFISHPEVREGVQRDEIASVRFGRNLDIERMLLLQPDLILTSISGDPAFDIPPQLTRADLPVVLSAGYMERHPLARAEWIKFYAAFFEADAAAARIFDGIAERYEALVAKAAEVAERPTVFCSAPYSGAWHMPGGESYTAQAIRDAGGDYLWAEVPTGGSIPLDTERVFLKAAEADFWINPSYYRQLDALLGADPRFAEFAAVANDRVYNNTRQVTESGGNPIWESGVIHPDRVLADLIQIFHPDLLPEREPVFYERLD